MLMYLLLFQDWCTVIAALMHFLYLSVFFIMLAKSFYLAKMLLWPMNRQRISKWCLLAAYGIFGLFSFFKLFLQTVCLILQY